MGQDSADCDRRHTRRRRLCESGRSVDGIDGPEVLAVAVETGFSTPEQLRESQPDLQLADLADGLDGLLDLIAVGEPRVE